MNNHNSMRNTSFMNDERISKKLLFPISSHSSEESSNPIEIRHRQQLESVYPSSTINPSLLEQPYMTDVLSDSLFPLSIDTDMEARVGHIRSVQYSNNMLQSGSPDIDDIENINNRQLLSSPYIQSAPLRNTGHNMRVAMPKSHENSSGDFNNSMSRSFSANNPNAYPGNNKPSASSPHSFPGTSQFSMFPSSQFFSSSSISSQGLDSMGEIDDVDILKHAALLEKRRKRRESHNAVERRRRDNINDRITELSTIVPDALVVPASESGGIGVGKPNKGWILKKSTEYIRSLQTENKELLQRVANLEQEIERLRNEISRG
jgi:hypothetical protein